MVKRQFFRMVTHVFGNSNLSQEIFAIDTWRAVLCSSGHGRKHMLTILPTIATITRCDLSPKFFCNDATLLCEFERDKI